MMYFTFRTYCARYSNRKAAEAIFKTGAYIWTLTNLVCKLNLKKKLKSEEQKMWIGFCMFYFIQVCTHCLSNKIKKYSIKI